VSTAFHLESFYKFEMNILRRTQVVVGIGLLLFGSAVNRVSARRLVGSHLPAQAQTEVEWQRFRVSGEEFSVLLPGVPFMDTFEAHLSERSFRRERTLASYANGVVYAVYTFERKSLSVKDLIHRFTNDDQPGRSSASVTVDGIKGASSRFETDDRMSAVELFATADNLYVFQAVGSKLDNPAMGMTKFFSSITLSKNPEGLSVVDGVGEQPAEILSSSTFAPRELTQKARVIIKPEPRYTEAARKNQITGTVVLRAVFSSSGAVTRIQPMSKLPDGLTDQAIYAARLIKFIPAIKDGRFVSMYVQLEYNFNLY
jgi:TonB family protein